MGSPVVMAVIAAFLLYESRHWHVAKLSLIFSMAPKCGGGGDAKGWGGGKHLNSKRGENKFLYDGQRQKSYLFYDPVEWK